MAISFSTHWAGSGHLGITFLIIYDPVSGKVVIMCQSSKMEFLKVFLSDPLPVESRLHDHPCDHFLSEISTETISCSRGGYEFVQGTFLYQRLTINGAYYEMQRELNYSFVKLCHFYALFSQIYMHRKLTVRRRRGKKTESH